MAEALLVTVSSVADKDEIGKPVTRGERKVEGEGLYGSGGAADTQRGMKVRRRRRRR